MAVTWKKVAWLDDVVAKSLFDAYSILYADTDNTPAALTVSASTFVGRKATGGVVAITMADARTLLNVADGATANSKATGAEIDTGTDDTKFVTAKAINDSHNVPDVAPGNNGHVMVSNGTDWASAIFPGAIVADNTAMLALTPEVGKMCWRTDELAPYICTVAA